MLYGRACPEGNGVLKNIFSAQRPPRSAAFCELAEFSRDVFRQVRFFSIPVTDSVDNGFGWGVISMYFCRRRYSMLNRRSSMGIYGSTCQKRTLNVLSRTALRLRGAEDDCASAVSVF